MSSPFEIRGVIEGFYGTPWTHDQRLDMIAFIARHGMNTFGYSPKDDPYLRRQWREPYAGEHLERLAELVTAAADAGVTFLYCLSPGLSMRYSDRSEIECVLAKFEQVRDLGVDAFGLLLDDIPDQLQHPADRAAYPDLVSAHIDVVGQVHAGLTDKHPHNSLVVCPTQYWGRGDETYISRLGQAVDPRIDLFWTGRAICSPSLDVADAATFSRATNRPPLYWDNYPVNDVAMTHELHIGPYRERDRQLHRFSRGVIANAMEHPEASKIAIVTIARYLDDPETYEPEESWDAAIREVVGETDADAFRWFADNLRTSCLSVDDAPRLAEAVTRFAFDYDYGDRDRAGRELAAVGEQFVQAARHLYDKRMANAALEAEAAPWLTKFSLGAEALTAVADLAAEPAAGAAGSADHTAGSAAAGRLDTTQAAATLRTHLDRLRADRHRVFGDVLEMFLADLVARTQDKP